MDKKNIYEEAINQVAIVYGIQKESLEVNESNVFEKDEIEFNQKAGNAKLWNKYYPNDQIYTVLITNSNFSDVDKDTMYSVYFDIDQNDKISNMMATSLVDNSTGASMIFPVNGIPLTKDPEYKDSNRPDEDEDFPELK